jgi:heterodisulfide reductase subunit C
VRDSKRKERAGQIADDYLWLCAHCYACSYCPKHVEPHDRIIDTKRATIEEGLTHEAGPRHALVVAKTIKQTGMLAENEVIVGTVGRFNFKGLIKVMPLGLRLASRGKVPPLFMKPVPKVDEIRTVFEELAVPVGA